MGTWQYAHSVCEPSGARVGIDERGLRDQHVRALGVLAAPDGGLRGGDLLERPAEVHGSGLAALGRAPRHRARERVVDLEDAGPVAVAAQRAAVAAGQRVAADREQLARRDVEEDGAGVGELVEALDLATGLDRAAERLEVGAHRRGDRRGAAARDGPAAGVAERQEHEPRTRTCRER